MVKSLSVAEKFPDSINFWDYEKIIAHHMMLVMVLVQDIIGYVKKDILLVLHPKIKPNMAFLVEYVLVDNY